MPEPALNEVIEQSLERIDLGERSEKLARMPATKFWVDKFVELAYRLWYSFERHSFVIAMTIGFTRLQEYLDAIARKANLDPANSRHGVFWHTTYRAFIAGNVPNKHCNGDVVPIIDPANAVNSAFNQILRGSWCAMPQMPKTGPFLTDDGYFVVLADGSRVEGPTILADIEGWLAAGAPENGDCQGPPPAPQG